MKQSVFNQYLDTRSASTEKRARIDMLDLKDQREGEAHILFRSKIIRAKMFYANPSAIKYMQLNQFLKVDKPPSKLLFILENQFNKFRDLLDSKSYDQLANLPEDEDIESIVENLRENEHLEPIERGIATLIALHSKPEETKTDIVETLSEDELNLFTPLRDSIFTNKYLLVNDRDEFSEAILDKALALSKIEAIERATGKSERQASGISDELINDMRMGTYYPPEIHTGLDADETKSIILELIEFIQEAREKGGSSD
jgi:intracellular multiplication protein IcmO